MAQVWSHHERLRADGYRGMVDLFTSKASLRKGLSRDRATELMLLYVGPHTYRALVIDYGSSLQAYLEWVSEALLRDLFGLEQSTD